MKKLSHGNKMRWIAGGLYALLTIYQLFLSKAILQQGNITNVPFSWMYGVCLIFGAAAMCIWMFHGREALAEGARRAVVAGTAFCVVLELMTYSDQTAAINITLYSLVPSLADNTVAMYVLMVLRLLVLIFAAYMAAITSRSGAAEVLDEAEENEAEKEVEMKNDEKNGEESTEIAEDLEEEIDAEIDEKIEKNTAEIAEK